MSAFFSFRFQLAHWMAGSALLVVTGAILAGAAPAPPASSASSAAAPIGNRKTIVVLGDSLAAGYGVDPSEAYPAILQKQLDAAGLDYTVVNAGVSGDTSAGALRRLDWLLRRRLDVLLLQIGGNDGLRGQSTEALKSNLEAIVGRTRKKYPGAQIIVAGMKMPPNMGTYAVQFEKVFAEVAREQNAALVPFLLEGVGGNANLNLPDGIHPNPEGHRIVATNVWSVLKPALATLPTAGN